MKAILGKTFMTILVACAAFYLADWATWRVRVAMGGGMGTVSVGVLIETPLKGEKEEYDWAGVQAVDCSRSILPHAGEGACWWLARKGNIEEK